ncbi:hypothetical protein [Acidisphaera sp. L21]|uniref:hypothetical protein n=1 Tax=Acidisphaera sp. L21 TaxID=1641851 RepID=UPI00131C23B2|nr:hypothetical protein [Acidisphaera sp. L21]
MRYPTTPDGRYFVVRGRLWRCSNPHLAADESEALTRELMAARRAKGVAMRAGDSMAREAARKRVDDAKVGLGERGAVWWTDGTPDWNRRMARTTPYAEWFAALGDGTEGSRSGGIIR